MVDPTLAQLMDDLVRFRPMLEQMYKRWLEEQGTTVEAPSEPTSEPTSTTIKINLTQSGDNR